MISGGLLRHDPDGPEDHDDARRGRAAAGRRAPALHAVHVGYSVFRDPAVDAGDDRGGPLDRTPPGPLGRVWHAACVRRRSRAVQVSPRSLTRPSVAVTVGEHAARDRPTRPRCRCPSACSGHGELPLDRRAGTSSEQPGRPRPATSTCSGNGDPEGGRDGAAEGAAGQHQEDEVDGGGLDRRRARARHRATPASHESANHAMRPASLARSPVARRSARAHRLKRRRTYRAFAVRAGGLRPRATSGRRAARR